MDYSCDITILCRVVDNYGDIGFAYRLARSLSRIQPHAFIRIITDDLHAFSLLAPEIDACTPVQQYNNWLIYDWNNADICTAAFSERQPRTILQCFQCGYPTWLEALLFEKKFPDVVHVVNIDYLTAESYAEEFHELASLTRSARVQKVNFMPGFTANTGGLLLDGAMNRRTMPTATCAPESVRAQNSIRAPYTSESVPHNTSVPHIAADMYSTRVSVNVPNSTLSDTSSAIPNSTREFSVLVFTYERDFMPLVRALSQFEKSREAFCTQHNYAPPTVPYDCMSPITPNAQRTCITLHEQRVCAPPRASQQASTISYTAFESCTAAPRRTVRAYVAAGSMQQSFAHAWHAGGKQFALTRLSFLPQREWDALLFSMDALFVRGEDSLSRACLSGIPFVWHAYRQDGDYQKVKVSALLKTMQPFFAKADFALLEAVWLAFNTTNVCNETQRNASGETCNNNDAQPQHKFATRAQSYAATHVERNALHTCTASNNTDARNSTVVSRVAITNSVANIHCTVDDTLAELLLQFLENAEKMRQSFAAFAASLIANGDFAQHLLNFLATRESPTLPQSSEAGVL
ncbi:MAG: elongation factor P maturation arginine rhamnosyltransferase EarP [Treponema sp.]|nr:elongation factor P maturation arginine rhamnosyltransferase EarP [Treponema sp.]